MRPPAPRDPQTLVAGLVMATLADSGVTEVVVSPGSRSTPLVLAAVAEPRLRCHSVVDERAAGYFALGLARRSGRPALLLCTSGTAGANYLPAVVEAGVAFVPLLVLTADRPIELAQGGANQTIDQLKLFGDHARSFVDLGVADADPRALRGVRRLVAQAASRCVYPEPGAVHLNFRARKPLEPVLATTESTEDHAAQGADLRQLLARPVVQTSLPQREPDPGAVAELLEAVGKAQRPLVVAGPAPIDADSVRPRALHRFARALGAPLLADPASQGRYVAPDLDDGRGTLDNRGTLIATYDLLLRDPATVEGLAPDLILQVGRGPTSGAWERFLEHQATTGTGAEACPFHWVVSEHGWPEAANTADRLVWCAPERLLDQVAASLEGSRDTTDSPWLSHLKTLDRRAQHALDATLATWRGLSEGAVARAVVAALPEDGLLVAGNSLPIRQLDLYATHAPHRLHVASQRGASGIDGVVAGAVGASLAHEGPTVLLVGDVSALHDLSGLATAGLVDHPLVVVIVHNQGGRIFEQLPLARHPAGQGDPFSLWTTPNTVDFAHAAALYDLPFERVTSVAALETVLARALKHSGAAVVEARVPPEGVAEQTQSLLRRWQEASAEEER